MCAIKRIVKSLCVLEIGKTESLMCQGGLPFPPSMIFFVKRTCRALVYAEDYA